jgi:hypothetical protein
MQTSSRSKTTRALLGIALAAIFGSVSAAPITFTDIYNPTPDYLFDGTSGTATLSFTHDIIDDGYNALTDAINDVSLVLRFKDESAVKS